MIVFYDYDKKKRKKEKSKEKKRNLSKIGPTMSRGIKQRYRIQGSTAPEPR